MSKTFFNNGRRDYLNEMNYILEKFSTYPQVDAIAIGGSRATSRYDEKSDYDVYIYLNSELPVEKRKEILEAECCHLELGNHFWELEDNGTLNSGTDFDLVYRNLNGFANEIADVVEKKHARNNYTTCFWHNLMTCKIVFEREGLLTNLKKRFDVPYPKELKESIVTNGMRLLHGNLPSFDLQIQKACKRKDYVSVNHRVTEFLATYFDVLFAVNETYNTGEKRMVTIAMETCKCLPDKFEYDFERLFRVMFTAQVTEVIADLVRNITKLVNEEVKNGEDNTSC